MTIYGTKHNNINGMNQNEFHNHENRYKTGGRRLVK